MGLKGTLSLGPGYIAQSKRLMNKDRQYNDRIKAGRPSDKGGKSPKRLYPMTPEHLIQIRETNAKRKLDNELERLAREHYNKTATTLQRAIGWDHYSRAFAREIREWKNELKKQRTKGTETTGNENTSNLKES